MIRIVSCDFSNSNHRKAFIDLLNEYIADPMGGAQPLSDEKSEKLIEELRNHPTSLNLLAEEQGSFVGLLNAYINIATFSAQKMINIHDVVVTKAARGKGIGRELMKETERIAQQINCSKITLEVRIDNPIAQELYKSEGYKECNPPMHFWVKNL